MKKEETGKDIEIIVEYEEKIDEKDEKSLQRVIQKLFDIYIIKVIQNINKGK